MSHSMSHHQGSFFCPPVWPFGSCPETRHQADLQIPLTQPLEVLRPPGPASLCPEAAAQFRRLMKAVLSPAGPGLEGPHSSGQVDPWSLQGHLKAGILWTLFPYPEPQSSPPTVAADMEKPGPGLSEDSP